MDMHPFEAYKPVMAMVGVQLILAMNALTGKTALSQGVNPMVFITYRQGIAALVLLPTILIARSRGGKSERTMGMKGFGFVFVAALVGATLSQYFYYRGLQLSSTSVVSAVCNSVPAITFLMAASIGLEKLQMNTRSMAKVFGTIICVGGAISITLFKGPKLLNMEFHTLSSIFDIVGEDWVIGCLLVLASNCCWSFWLILQVPICERYLDPLSFSSWMCFLAFLQSATLTYFLEPDLGAWKINSGIVVVCLLYTGIVGSAVVFYLQSWCISRRGPLFTAMFSPLCTVVVTISAILFLHEELYLGSLAGASAVVGGLYIVLWGKAKDFSAREPCLGEDHTKIIVSVDETSFDRHTDMKEPLLLKN